MSKLVSVCIPAYNSAEYIGRTIESVLSQTYENLELIVVDDCSVDNTVDIVRSFLDERVRLICNEQNLGMTGNWNKCINEAKGEYIKLIPADDCIYPECIEQSVAVLSDKPEISLVIVGSDLVNNEDRVIGSYMHWKKQGLVKGSIIAKRSAMYNNFFGNPVCAMFRKKDFERTGGFDKDIPYILDFDLWLMLTALGDVWVIKDKLSAFRVRRDSNTGVLTGKGVKIYNEEHRRLLDKHIGLGTFRMNRIERRFSIVWRAMRNGIIAFYIRIKNR